MYVDWLENISPDGDEYGNNQLENYQYSRGVI